MSIKDPLMKIIEENESKFFALFNLSGGRLSTELKAGEKGDFVEIKVLNDEARLAGIVWFFGPRKAYIEDIRKMVARKENQRVPMVLVAAEGTTSQGKRELKPAEIQIVRDLESIKDINVSSKKKKTKKVDSKEKEIRDVKKLPDTPIMNVVQNHLKLYEPEFVTLEKLESANGEMHEIRAYSSTKDLLVIYRTVEKDSIGVDIVRKFIELKEQEDLKQIPTILVVLKKFTPTAKKEANENGIILVSVEQSQPSMTGADQPVGERLRKGAIEIIEQRGYKIIKKTDSKFTKLNTGSESLGTYLYAQNDEGKSLLVLIPSEEVVRVATVREFKEQIDALNIDDGMLIALKRFTYTAEREAKEFGISALRKNHPVFNIFNHFLVPVHELMTHEEVDEMLAKYNAKLIQLPRIYEDDPGVVAINGKVGDVIRIIRENSENYRLVVPRPEGGRTENSALVHMTRQRMERLEAKKKA